MPKLKSPPPCSNQEFIARRAAVGLDNHSFAELSGCSISSVTKWSAGCNPVSIKAEAVLREVERAVHDEAQYIFETNVTSADEIIIIKNKPDAWVFGKNSYITAMCRARSMLHRATGKEVRLDLD